MTESIPSKDDAINVEELQDGQSLLVIRCTGSFARWLSLLLDRYPNGHLYVGARAQDRTQTPGSGQRSPLPVFDPIEPRPRSA